MKVVDGLLNAKKMKPATPKPSPEGFQWPNQREADQDVAEKIGASLQELLPAKDWKHVDLARALWGSIGPNESPRNTGTARRWVLGELPIPNAEAAAAVAQVLDVSMARLLKPNGKFDPHPDMIRERSPNGVNLAKMGKKKKKAKGAKTARSRNAEKQRAYNAAYRERKKAEKAGRRKYTKRPKPAIVAANGNGAWILADGVAPPEYTIKSAVEGPAGHVSFTLNAVLPHERAMAILHMLQHGTSGPEG
jgi:hypothetical protein